ncbi:MAG: ABC transporter permease [Candidatus Doudnabacteria bacterium]|nr:ABC transporter permease [Candidatus Doudnabacteria bacterium]
MNFISTIKLVFRTLLARKGRSFLTILGIVIGVAGVIIIISLGAGAQALVLGQVTKLGTNLINISPGKSNEKGPPSSVFGIVVTTLTTDDADALRDKGRVPHATGVLSVVRGQETVKWTNKDIDTAYVGVDYIYPQVVNFDMEEGRFFDEREDKGNANVAVLGYTVKQDLFGDTDSLGEIIKIKNLPFRVVGVIAKRGSAFFENQDDQILIPLEIAQKQLLGIHHLQAINIKIDKAENVKQTIADASAVLMERHRIKNEVDADFTIRDIADAVSILKTITNALRIFLAAMAAIALIVGGIGILNIMMVTVAERTREIGLRKAVGATNTQVRNQFLFESGLMTLIGGIIGIIVGIIISYLVALIARASELDWAFVISWQAILLAIGVSILTGVIFGIYPAIKASKFNPIDALRYE